MELSFIYLAEISVDNLSTAIASVINRMGYESSTLIGKLFGVTAIGFVAFEFGGSVVHFLLSGSVSRSGLAGLSVAAGLAVVHRAGRARRMRDALRASLDESIRAAAREP
jgi:hypothetical protein